ncbi:MAG: DUF4397 domain-containing protein [Haloarculaceae archaeon]
MNTQLGIGHFSPDAPAVDILADGAPLFENVAFGDSSSHAMVEADVYDIDVGPAGSEDSVLGLPETSFDGATSYTVFPTGMLEDNSLDAALVADYVLADADDRPAAAQ